MLRLTSLACLSLYALVAIAAPNTSWYDHGTTLYQIYPRSFKDSNGDGIGDLEGIIGKLEHAVDSGVNAIWLSPIYPSPQKDFGYDISNFVDIDPVYGTLDTFDRLLAKAKSLGLKVILDFVPNHSSDQHPWFQKSVQRIKPYDDYYVWRDAKIVNGVRQPPNNWLSIFHGSAWEWNEQRQQYYLHQFAVGQPDLNYRNEAVNQEMKNVLTFWMKRGVDGFRIDAINHMFEDPRFLDEPKSNVVGVPDTDPDSLDHIYTKNLNETYEVLKSWRQLMDDYSSSTNTDSKMILTEAYASHELTVRYYDSGSTVPFNFMFINELNKGSSAADFKRLIDEWMNSVPAGQVANWVSGNHDQHRVVSRFGRERADQIMMLTLLLPGVSVVYNGDEIGMEDRWFTYEETVDPAGRNAGPERYYLKSRDPERTPYQWDRSTSAGFSSSYNTWLPVNMNYWSLNLEAEKSAPVSHYKVFQALTTLKRNQVVVDGSLQVNVLANKLLSVVRRSGSSVVVLLINFSEGAVVTNVKNTLNLPDEMKVYTASVYSQLSVGSTVKTGWLNLRGVESLVLTTPDIPLPQL